MENKETSTQKKDRLEKRRQQEKERMAKLSSEELEDRKNKKRPYMKNYRSSQSEEGRAARLHQMRQYSASQSEEERAARLQQKRQYKAHYRASQSEEGRAARLQQMRQYNAHYGASQSKEKRAARLQQMRQYNAHLQASQSEEEGATKKDSLLDSDDSDDSQGQEKADVEREDEHPSFKTPRNPLKHVRKTEDSPAQQPVNCMKFLPEVATTRDEYSVFGEHVTYAVRKCNRPKLEVSLAQHYISDILYRLEIGLLTAEIPSIETPHTPSISMS